MAGLSASACAGLEVDANVYGRAISRQAARLTTDASSLLPEIQRNECARTGRPSAAGRDLLVLEADVAVERLFVPETATGSLELVLRAPPASLLFAILRFGPEAGDVGGQVVFDAIPREHTRGAVPGLTVPRRRWLVAERVARPRRRAGDLRVSELVAQRAVGAGELGDAAVEAVALVADLVDLTAKLAGGSDTLALDSGELLVGGADRGRQPPRRVGELAVGDVVADAAAHALQLFDLAVS